MPKQYRKPFIKRNRYKNKSNGTKFQFKGSPKRKVDNVATLKFALSQMGFNSFAK
jgi:hypothetical protein